MATAHDALGNETSYVYDAAGRLISSTDADARTTSLTYDAAGRTNSITAPGGSSVAMNYDDAGRLLSIIDANSYSTEFGYDAAGNQTSVTDANDHTSFSTFDLAGQLLSTTDATGVVTQFTYTPAGQLASRADGDSNTTSYVYDARGQLTAATDPTGNTASYEYDAAGRLISQTSPSGAVSTATYDAAGQLLAATDANAAVTNFAYDLAGQAVSTTDPLGRVTSTAYTLDGQPSVGLLATTVGGDTLAYNAAQQLTSLTPLLGVPTAYAYDARGSRVWATTGSDVTGYTYTPSGALASVTTPSVSVSYTSDAGNLRQSRTVGGTTRQFTWSTVGGLPLLLGDGGHSYVYGPSSTPLAQVDDSTGLVEYLHADLLGSPRLVTDGAGAAVGAVSFDAFGTVAAQTGVGSAFGFTGNWADPDTGFVYLRARDYDPATGQFLVVDPAVDLTGQPYAYAGNSPLALVDPTGLWGSDPLTDLVQLTMSMISPAAAQGIPSLMSQLYSGEDFAVAANRVYNPVYNIMEGWDRAYNDSLNGCDISVVAGDVLQYWGGAIGILGLFGGLGGLGSRASGVADTTQAVVVNGETTWTRLGRQMHANWDYGSGFQPEFRLLNGQRADAVNFSTREVVELKPNSQRSINTGYRQLAGYIEQLNKEYPGDVPWAGRVETYDR